MLEHEINVFNSDKFAAAFKESEISGSEEPNENDFVEWVKMSFNPDRVETFRQTVDGYVIMVTFSGEEYKLKTTYEEFKKQIDLCRIRFS